MQIESTMHNNDTITNSQKYYNKRAIKLYKKSLIIKKIKLHVIKVITIKIEP